MLPPDVLELVARAEDLLPKNPGELEPQYYARVLKLDLVPVGYHLGKELYVRKPPLEGSN